MIFSSPLQWFKEYEYRRYQAIADSTSARGEPDRVRAENAAGLAWRLHHPVRYGLIQMQQKCFTRKGLAYQLSRLVDRLEKEN